MVGGAAVIHTLGLILLGGSIVGAALLLIWQQWAVVNYVRRDDLNDITPDWRHVR